MTERILYDYNWYVLIYDHGMNQMALVFLYSDDVIVYNGHVLQTTETYDESIRPCILKLKAERQHKEGLRFHRKIEKSVPGEQTRFLTSCRMKKSDEYLEVRF